MLYTSIMQVFQTSYKTEIFHSPIFDEYFGGMSFCCFDIETLGLSPSRAPMILAGFLDVAADGTATNTQYYLETPEDEATLLRETVEKLNSYDLLVTYNGRSFDVPYVTKRYAMIHGRMPEIRPFNLDLYQMVRFGSSLKDVLTGMRQKNVEEYMGVAGDRTDEISGAESIQLYQEAIFEPDEVKRSLIREKILLHNSDDVAQLYRILPIIRQCDMHKVLAMKGFPVIRSGLTNALIPDRLTITRNRLVSGKLKIEGAYPGEPFSYVSFPSIDSPLDVNFTSNGKFAITLPVETRSRAQISDLREFLANPEDLSKYGGYVNGYLILKENGELNYREINALARKICQIV